MWFPGCRGTNREYIDAGIPADFGRRDNHPRWRGDWEVPPGRGQAARRAAERSTAAERPGGTVRRAPATQEARQERGNEVQDDAWCLRGQAAPADRFSVLVPGP